MQWSYLFCSSLSVSSTPTIVLVLFFILKLPCKNFLLNNFQLSAHINIPYHPHHLNSRQLSSFQFSWQSNWNCSILLLADFATRQPAPASQASPDVWQQNSGGLSWGAEGRNSHRNTIRGWPDNACAMMYKKRRTIDLEIHQEDQLHESPKFCHFVDFLLSLMNFGFVEKFRVHNILSYQWIFLFTS